ncbi:MAG: twin-arginine translocation signal domain-containing protein [Acidimicrobiales bacterium]
MLGAVASPGGGLLHFVQLLVGNVFLAALGVGGIVLLARRDFLKVVEFAVVGVAVGTFVYAPGVYVSLARQAASTIGVVI